MRRLIATNRFNGYVVEKYLPDTAVLSFAREACISYLTDNKCNTGKAFEKCLQNA